MTLAWRGHDLLIGCGPRWRKYLDAKAFQLQERVGEIRIQWKARCLPSFQATFQYQYSRNSSLAHGCSHPGSDKVIFRIAIKNQVDALWNQIGRASCRERV